MGLWGCCVVDLLIYDDTLNVLSATELFDESRKVDAKC